MKRITAALALTAALTLGVTAHAQSQTDPVKPAELKDVPAGHWAQEAIKIAADCGLLRGFPDGTYRGQQPFTRYQAAVVIARLLNVIQNGQCGIGKPGTDGTMIDPAQLEALQNAVQELSADLAQLGVRVAELEDNAVTQDDLARVEDLATQARDLAEAASGTGGGVSPDDLARVEEIANEARDLAEAAATATGADPEALQNLTDQVEAASIAADTALAQARELQDKVDELSGRVDDLSGQVDELTATVEGQADSIAALNDLVVLLNQDVLSLQDRVAQLEAGQADLSTQLEGAATQEDLDALREFTTLLRRDQTALQDRVADLEARVTKNEGDIKALDARVTVLEANAFTISGSLSLTYQVGRTWYGNGAGAAPDFDIDRLGLTTRISSGAPSGVGGARDYGDFANSNYPLDDNGEALGGKTPPAATSLPGTPNSATSRPTGNQEGYVNANVAVNFTLKPRNLLSDPGSFPAGSITIGLNLNNGDDYANTNAQANRNQLTGVTLNLTGLSAAFKVGAAPAIVNFGQLVPLAFSKYVLNNASGRGDGFTADLGGAGFPLNASLSLAYGSKAGGFGPVQTVYDSAGNPAGDPLTPGAQMTNIKVTDATTSRGIFRLDFDNSVRGQVTVYFSNGENVTKTFDSGTGQSWVVRSPVNGVDYIGNYNGARGRTIVRVTFQPVVSINGNDGDNVYYAGVKGSLSLIPGLTGSIYAVQEGGDATAGFPKPEQVFGLSAAGKIFGLLDLEGEYNASSAGGGQTLGYVNAGITLGIFSVKGNYRNIESGWDGLGDNTGPYSTNQRGFGVELAVDKLFNFLSLSGYYDSRTKLGGRFLPSGPKQPTFGNPATATGATNFGVAATISVIGFDLTGSYDSITETGNSWITNTFALTANHDGSKPTALIKGLNLALGFRNETYNGNAGTVTGFDPVANVVTVGDDPQNDALTTLYAYADLTIGAPGSFQLTPKAYYTSATYTVEGNVSDFGVGLTATIPFLFSSKLDLGAAYDSATYGAGLGGFTASTTLLKAGLSWDSFIVANSSFSVYLASRTDINGNGIYFGPTFDTPDAIGASYFNNSQPWRRDGAGRGSSLTGLYFDWGYYGLQFSYGIFSYVSFADATGPIWGQTFKIGYTVKF